MKMYLLKGYNHLDINSDLYSLNKYFFSPKSQFLKNTRNPVGILQNCYLKNPINFVVS